MMLFISVVQHLEGLLPYENKKEHVSYLILQRIIKDLLPKCADYFPKGHPNFEVLFMTDRFDLISSSLRATYFTQLAMISS